MPDAARGRTDAGNRRSLLDQPLQLMAVLVATAIVAEVAVLLATSLFPELSPAWQRAIDVLILVAFLVPLLAVLIHRPMRRRLAEHERVIAELVQSEQRFRDITDNAREWIWEVDATGRYTFSSNAVEAILGYRPAGVIGRHFHDFFHPEDQEQHREAAFATFARKRPFQGFLNRNVHRDGRAVWLLTSGVPILAADGTLLGYRGAATVRFDEESLTDPVTGLVNRTGFELLAEQQLRVARRARTPVALLFADLDRFKAINDTLGHAAGDRALADVADVLRGSIRAADVVARLGGDEFVVLLSDAGAETAPQVVVDKLRHHLAEFNATAGRPYGLEFSAGIARFDPAAPVPLAELLRRADAAMYADKRRRRQAAG